MMQYTDPNDSERVKYELHGDCKVWGVDISNWVSETSQFKCQLGFYYNAQDMVDWHEVDMLYNGQNTDPTLTCKDGKSTSADSFSYTTDFSKDCDVMASDSGYAYSENGDTADFKSHWMRDFYTGDSNGDLELILSKTVAASLQITLGAEQPIQIFNSEFCLKMEDCEQAQANTLGATSAMLALVLIQYIWG